ncbi:hypothetical protein [Vibrio diabolicus]|uniref:hypothetical protein n=1 Tax=Vibrio diabolicus TaxID=50719 RepID=UPI00211B58B5|nr:hypothetical protein [Vibrio diabolicus]MCG6283757.1 hypothetical protein [Vibrio diabolicus]MCR9307217.1 hypothetical protein [Vibrio diabolicus]
MKTYRNTIFIEYRDKDIEVIKPELTVLVFDNVGKRAHVDVGSWCYSCRGSGKNSPSKSRPVDDKSIVRGRVTYIEKIIEGLRGSTLSQSSVLDYATKISLFIDFLDKNGFSLSCDEDWVNGCYSYYENLLLRARAAPGTKNRMTDRSASSNLVAAKRSLVWALETSDSEINVKIPHIKEVRSPTTPRDTSERNKFVQILLAIFERFCDVLINNIEFPFVLDLSHWDCGSHVFSRASQLDSKSNILSFVNEDASIIPREEIRARYNSWKECVGVMSIYDKWRKRLDETNNSTSDLQRRSLFNYATYCYYLAFIGIAGSNNSVTSRLRFDQCEKYQFIDEKSPKGYIFTGLKVRAGNKVIYPTIGRAFSKFHHKYEKLREWGENEFSLEKQNLGFYRIVKYGKSSPINGSSMETLKAWLLGHFPQIIWQSPRELRKGVSWTMWNLSNGDINSVAWKLQNDVNTTLNHYLIPPKYEGLKSFSKFMDSMWEEAIESSREKRHISVKINSGKHKTPAGHCNAQDNNEAELESGFIPIVPMPNCARSETCFFCKHYVIHADEEDIQAILSLRELIKQAQRRATSELSYIIKFAPILYRIEEILCELKRKFPSKLNIIESISKNVEHGEFSPHWQSHFELLLELEDISCQ